MRTRTQGAFMAAAVAGIALMGFAGWWVGGMGVAKVAAPVADAAVMPEATPTPAASPAVADHTNTTEPPVVKGDVNVDSLRSLGQQMHAGQVTMHTDAATGNLIITGDNGQQVVQSGVVFLNRADPATAGGKAVGGGPTVFKGGNGTVTLVTDTNNGNVTTFTITSEGGTTKLTNGNGGTISGKMIVIRDGQGQVQTKVIEPVAVPAVSPGLP